MSIFQATASAPVNIACIKCVALLSCVLHPLISGSRYWGKRDTKLILPTNSSLSVTLDQDHLRSTTTSRADPSFTQDRLWLNGKEEEIKDGGRLATCIKEMRSLRNELEEKDANIPKVRSCSPNPPISEIQWLPMRVDRVFPRSHCLPQ